MQGRKPIPKLFDAIQGIGKNLQYLTPATETQNLLVAKNYENKMQNCKICIL